ATVEPSGDRDLRVVRLARRAIDLGAVTGGQDRRLGGDRVEPLAQVGERRPQGFARERHALAQPERRGLVVQSEREQVHKGLNVIGFRRRWLDRSRAGAALHPEGWGVQRRDRGGGPWGRPGRAQRFGPAAPACRYWPPLRGGSLRCSPRRPRRETRYARCASCARTLAASQKYEARFAR